MQNFPRGSFKLKSCSCNKQTHQASSFQFNAKTISLYIMNNKSSLYGNNTTAISSDKNIFIFHLKYFYSENKNLQIFFYLFFLLTIRETGSGCPAPAQRQVVPRQQQAEGMCLYLQVQIPIFAHLSRICKIVSKQIPSCPRQTGHDHFIS